ncbi:MAG: FHA domain-containing protein [Anaerolineae bacterium]|nr:FHA domain-containing protein [Anaerolineae bacterium]
MSRLQEIYTEYARMRDNGLDTKSAINVLRPHIEKLGKADRDELSATIKAYEMQLAESPPPSARSASAPEPAQGGKGGVIKRINPQQASAPPESAAARKEALPVSDPDATVVWKEAAPQLVKCPTCGKANQRGEVFCYACGNLLEPPRNTFDTNILSDGDSKPLESEFFGPESHLVLRLRGSTESYDLRPQDSAHELVIGRSTAGSAMNPDVDLKNKQAADLGVSRFHLSVFHDKENQAVLVSDLGSANGSFINGQRLLAKEVRVLRHGDELRLGRLVLIVSFRHPGGTTR